ncbi:MAG: hypothetical protein GY764_06715 [Halieaceae bacterium]|nr:hypothetical protein [Halieaceae bacterium]
MGTTQLVRTKTERILAQQLMRLLLRAALALGALAPAQAQLPNFKDFKDIGSTLINPIGTANAWVAGHITREAGVDPALLRRLVNPMPSIVLNAPAAVEAQARAEFRRFKNEVRAMDALFRGNPSRLQRAAQGWVGAHTDKVLNDAVARTLQPLMSPVVPWFLRDTYMDAPYLVEFGHGFAGGDPVFYVNGMLTTYESAAGEAQALSRQLRRPVYLLYNPTRGAIIDLAEAALDRAWAFSLNPIQRAVQHNAVTRQLTHIIYHARVPISLVTHSQGCIIARNAILTANSFSGGKARLNVAWVATGLPLNDDEIYPMTGKLMKITNRRDPVAELVGISLKLDGFEFDMREHSFEGAYMSTVSSEDLWGNGAAVPVSWRGEVTGELVRAIHNTIVYDNMGQGKRGVRFILKVNAKNLKGVPCMAVAYFNFQGAQVLRDMDGDYRDASGGVATSCRFLPPYAGTEYAALGVEIPYDELHLGPGRHLLDVNFIFFAGEHHEYVGKGPVDGMSLTF